MVEDINLKDFPQASGVYKLIWNGSVIYVGSSNDLYQRMCVHKNCIKKGSNHGYKKGFYLFLQNNHFSVELELTEDYLQIEQELIEYFEPIFNQNRSFTGCGTAKGRKTEWQKEYNQKFKDEVKQYQKQYRETHKEEKNQYQNQKCKYNGEILTLNALKNRFQRKGIPHATQEAKKYLLY